jgi:hypothetical protein
MKVDIGPEGHIVTAEDLGPLLRLDPALVQSLMKSGAITSQFEKGADADEGLFRMTFWYGQVRVRLTYAEDGTVLSHSRNKSSKLTLAAAVCRDAAARLMRTGLS